LYAKRIDAFLRIAAQLDDGALAAIATRGLLRRAHKDLERARPAVGDVAGERLIVQVEAQRVALALDPRESQCDCAAARVCRHVVAAWLALRQLTPEPAYPLPGDEIQSLLAIADEELERWTSPQRVRRARLSVARGIELVIASERPLVLQLVQLKREVRSLGGGRLRDLLCSCHATRPCEHRVVAVLALQAARGARTFEGDLLASAAAEVPRDRRSILDALAKLLEELIAHGMVRCSPAQRARARARSLATAAAGLELLRLERSLRGLALELELSNARSVRASADSLLLRAAELEALRVALYEPRHAGLIGSPRTRYSNVGELRLHGLGARAFVTASGTRALAVYFWDGESQRFNVWSSACVGARSTPSRRFRSPGPWTGCRDPEHASGSEFRLAGAWRSVTGRLSSRTTTRMQARGESKLDQIPAIDDWSVLLDRAGRLFAAGIRSSDEDDCLVFIRPSALEPGAFDDIHQRWSCRARDGLGRAIELVWEHDECQARAIRWSERHATNRWQRVLGILRLRSHGVQIEPIAIALDGQLVSPTLQTRRSPVAAPGAGAFAATEDTDLEEGDADDGERIAPLQARGPLGDLLGAVWGCLVDGAEHGTRDPQRALVPDALRHRLSSAGLAECARVLAQPSIRGDQRARQLLRAAYVVAATQRALVLAAAGGVPTCSRD
jgi:hypothetical protein